MPLLVAHNQRLAVFSAASLLQVFSELLLRLHPQREHCLEQRQQLLQVGAVCSELRRTRHLRLELCLEVQPLHNLYQVRVCLETLVIFRASLVSLGVPLQPLAQLICLETRIQHNLNSRPHLSLATRYRHNLNSRIRPSLAIWHKHSLSNKTRPSLAFQHRRNLSRHHLYLAMLGKVKQRRPQCLDLVQHKVSRRPLCSERRCPWVVFSSHNRTRVCLALSRPGTRLGPINLEGSCKPINLA